MTNERNALKAGIFIIVSLCLVVAIVVAIKGVGRFLEPTHDLTAAFDLTEDVGGLNVGDEVRIGGYKVGTVRSIDLVTPAGAGPVIDVVFSVPTRFDVKKDAKISVQGTLTGVSWLNFDDLGKGPALAAGDKLDGRPGAMTVLFASLGDLAPEITGVVRDARNTTLPKLNGTLDTFKTTGESATGLLTDVRGRVGPMVEKYNGVTDSAKGALDNVGSMFGDSKADFRTAIANVKDATGTVKERLPSLFDRADQLMAKVTSAVEDAGAALQDVRKVASNTKDISVTVRQVINQNRGKLEAMISSLKTTGDNLKNASAEVRRSPWRLLYKPGPGEMANLNLYDSARQFADGANELSTAAVALRDALSDPDIDPALVQKLVEKLDTTFANFDDVEKQLWSQVQQ